MILQLGTFSLLLLLLYALRLASPWVPGLHARTERIDNAVTSAARTYGVFAIFALYAYLQGKPELAPQYLAWLIVIIQAVRAAAYNGPLTTVPRLLGLVQVGVLIYLWIDILPLFPHAAR